MLACAIHLAWLGGEVGGEGNSLYTGGPATAPPTHADLFRAHAMPLRQSLELSCKCPRHLWTLLVLTTWAQQSKYLTARAPGFGLGKCHASEAIAQGFDQMSSTFVDIVCAHIMDTARLSS